ncbi:MAG: sugar transferase, partial [Chloroflexi bacterium]|nr:sugar transferase [Chloroflexota bacterium]
MKDHPTISAPPYDPNYSPRVAWLPRWGLQLSERRALLFAGDVMAAGLAVASALALWTATSSTPTTFRLALAQSRLYWLALAPFWLLLNARLYDLRAAASPLATLRSLLISVSVALGLYLAAYFYAPPSSLLRLVVFYFILTAFGFDLAWRLMYIAVLTSRTFRRRVLIVGAGWAGEAMAQALRESAAEHYALAGLIDDDPTKHGQVIAGAPVIGGHERLLEAIRARHVSEIVLAITGELRGETFRALLECQEQGVDIVRMSVLYEEILGRVPIEHLQADWLITSLPESMQFNNLTRVVKRLIDLAGALSGLMVLALMLPGVAIAVRLTSPGPIFYRQTRTGRGGKPFTAIKFRTMAPDAEADGLPRWAAPEDPRVTGLGRFLRRMRLDELPQCL